MQRDEEFDGLLGSSNGRRKEGRRKMNVWEKRQMTYLKSYFFKDPTKRNELMLSDMTPKEKMQLDTQKRLQYNLKDKLVLKEQVILMSDFTQDIKN